MTRQGLPTATQFSGIERVTTLPAPITLFLPMTTPGKRIAPPPIQTLSSILTGREKVRQKHPEIFLFSCELVRPTTSVVCVAV